MAKAKLKPCPFCGSKAERHQCGHSIAPAGDWFVQCMKCFASTEIQETQGEATRAWNRRVALENS